MLRLFQAINYLARTSVMQLRASFMLNRIRIARKMIDMILQPFILLLQPLHFALERLRLIPLRFIHNQAIWPKDHVIANA